MALPYLMIALGLVAALLIYASYRTLTRFMWRSEQQGLLAHVYELENRQRKAELALREHEAILAQVGELFDHLGVELEGSPHPQVSTDVKEMGAHLRSYADTSSPAAQRWLAKLGERYGIEPRSGGVFTLRELVLMVEVAALSALSRRNS